MEIAEEKPELSEKSAPAKRDSIFKRLRRRFTLVFRRPHVRKRTKSESHAVEKEEHSPNSEENTKLRLSLTTDEPKELDDSGEHDETIKPLETNFRPPAKVPLFVNDFTSELKQSLKLRSKKMEESETSPTEAIKQIEVMRALSSISDDFKSDVKIEVETKTFEEKLALFESQISGGSESLHDTLKRNKSDPGDTDEGLEEWNEDTERKGESEDKINGEIEEKDTKKDKFEEKNCVNDEFKENLEENVKIKVEKCEEKEKEKNNRNCLEIKVSAEEMKVNEEIPFSINKEEDDKETPTKESCFTNVTSEEITYSINVVKSDLNDDISEKGETISNIIKENYVLEQVNDDPPMSNGNSYMNKVEESQIEFPRNSAEELDESVQNVKCLPEKDEQFRQSCITESSTADVQ